MNTMAGRDWRAWHDRYDDLIPVLAAHPRGREVTARLVEPDPVLAETARQAAAASGLPLVEVVTGDAALTVAYAGLTPADLVPGQWCGRVAGQPRTRCHRSAAGSPRTGSHVHLRR